MRAFLRRSCITLVAVAAATIVLRDPIAEALIARGDAVLRSATPQEAQHYYYRALWFDPRSADATDRVVLVSLMTHSGTAAALRAAHRAGDADQGNPAIAEDEGLLEFREREFRSAERDFARAARLDGDARAFAFAAIAARRGGDERSFARFRRRAVALDPIMLKTHVGRSRS